MANVKTAISIQEALFEEVEALAGEMNISRSRLFAIAIEEFIQRRRNRQLLQQINAAYDDMPDPGESERQRRMKAQHRQLIEGQW